MNHGPILNALWPPDDYTNDKALCIEFANTVSWRGKPQPDENLPSPSEWLDWLRANNVLPQAALQNLTERTAESPDEAVAGLERAKSFREALYNLLSAYCLKEEPAAKDRMLVQDVLVRAMSHLRFARHDGRWTFELETTPDWEAALYGPALSCAQLLTGSFADKVKFCERDECRWLFLDLTKNHSRKWCDMTTCGNVVKARASYARRKAASSSTP